MEMIYPPPTKSNILSINLKLSKPTIFLTAFLSAFATYASPIAQVDENNILTAIDHSESNITLTDGIFQDGLAHEHAGLKIEHYAKITANQFSINLRNNTTLEINGDTNAYLHGQDEDDHWMGGAPCNYLFYANSANYILNGNVSARIDQVDGPTKVGANLLYLDNNSTATIGNSASSVMMWTLARSPDLLSAKNGSKVWFKSTQNQLVGTIDLMDDRNPTHWDEDFDNPSLVDITFSGADSFWFGDEKTWMNSDWKTNNTSKTSYEEWEKNGDTFNLVFKDKAQWTYLGIQSNRDKEGMQYTIPKRISSITLEGGIINLYDADIEKYWKDLGLWDLIQNEDFQMDVEGKHDYVRIGDLKGNGGIFRLDLDGNVKSQSDMIYIEGGEGTHYFEPYNLELLESITPDNTLTFALVAKGTSVRFHDKQNMYGKALVDYELEIAKKEGITTEELADPENAYWDKTANIDATTADQADLAVKIDITDFIGGDNWFIRRVTLKESAAAVGMTGAGYASYDAAVEMDRRDRRLLETVRSADNDLWVRIHHGRNGAENQYRWDRTGVTIGFDRAFSEKSRAGAWFSYTEGDTEFLDVRGDGDMKRYELAVFDTLTYGNHYLDFVGRIGRVSNEYTVGNEAYTTDGDYDQDYAALSAEYGYTLKSETGVFVEPQVQFQVAYLDSFDYRTDRGMKVEADSETSTIGRIGFRAGREFRNVDNAGELYFRGDVLHQFTDGQDAVLSDGLHTFNENWGDTGTWANFGVGAVWSWKDRFQFQFDAERVAGGKTADTWLLSGRVNYLF